MFLVDRHLYIYNNKAATNKFLSNDIVKQRDI